MAFLQIEFTAAAARRLGENKILEASGKAATCYGARTGDTPTINHMRLEYNELCVMFMLKSPAGRKTDIDEIAKNLGKSLGGTVSVNHTPKKLAYFAKVSDESVPQAYLRYDESGCKL